MKFTSGSAMAVKSTGTQHCPVLPVLHGAVLAVRLWVSPTQPGLHQPRSAPFSPVITSYLPVLQWGLFCWFFSVFGLCANPFGGQPRPVLLILAGSACHWVVSIVIMFPSVLFAIIRARPVI